MPQLKKDVKSAELLEGENIFMLFVKTPSINKDKDNGKN